MEYGLPMIMLGWLMLAVVSAADTPGDLPPGRIRVACVGDSITGGAGLNDPGRESYPAVLQSLLGPGYEVRNFGVNGATALRDGSLPYWILPEFEAARHFAPQVVVLMLGTNDARLRHRDARPRFEADLRALGRQFADLESRPVVALGLPPPCYGLLNAYDQRVLRREILPAIRRIAREESWMLVDVHQALNNRSKWFPDGVHPDAAGAAAIARVVSGPLQTIQANSATERSGP
jgi:acyl-CoA thioesterase-1